MMTSVISLAILQSLFSSIHWRQDACQIERPMALPEHVAENAMACFAAMYGDSGDDEDGDCAPCNSLKRRRRDEL